MLIKPNVLICHANNKNERCMLELAGKKEAHTESIVQYYEFNAQDALVNNILAI